MSDECEMCGWCGQRYFTSSVDGETIDMLDELGQRIALLAANEVLFFNPNYPRRKPNDPWVMVSCNDVFMWGCADLEDIDPTEIDELFDWWWEDRTHGAAKWCCKKRGMRPQPPLAKLMKDDGAWEDWMDRLDANPAE